MEGGCRLGWTFQLLDILWKLMVKQSYILYIGMYLVQEVVHTNGCTLVGMLIILFSMYFIH